MQAHQVRSYAPGVTADDRTPELTDGGSTATHPPTLQYEIRVKGHLAARWSAWFDGLSLTNEPDGTTAIRGPVVDQAALHGLLQKLRDVGLPLVSLTELPPDEPPRPDHEGN
jgi:hypothetical protein